MPAVAKKKADEGYLMPVSYKGHIVMWFYGGINDEANAYPAMVIEMAQRSLILQVFTGDGVRHMDCVRHIDDPFLKDEEKAEQGAWEYIPQDLEMYDNQRTNWHLATRLTELEKKWAALEKKSNG